MKFICAKCLTPVEDPDEMEGLDGYTYHCTCGAPIAYVPYDECEEDSDGLVTVTFTPQQVDYLKHLIEKQIDKLEGGLEQLIDTLEILKGN